MAITPASNGSSELGLAMLRALGFDFDQSVILVGIPQLHIPTDGAASITFAVYLNGRFIDRLNGKPDDLAPPSWDY